jgi:hypothetical protein
MSSEGSGIGISVHEVEITDIAERKLTRKSRSTHSFVRLTTFQSLDPQIQPKGKFRISCDSRRFSRSITS